MGKSYISIRSDKGIVYQGEGSIFEGDFRMKINGGILGWPWYSVLEVRQEDDQVMVSVVTALKEDFYRIGDQEIFSSTCKLNFLETIIKNFKENK